MNKRTRPVVLITAAVMILLSIFTSAAAEETTGMNEDGLIYEVRTDADTGEKYAVVYDCMYIIPDLVIPAEIEGVPVREVAAGFTSLRIGWDTGLETLTVEEGVRAIGDRAFINCLSLREVSLPETLTDIGECAFANCVSLEQIHLPASLTHIGDQAFVNIGVKGLKLPENAAGIQTGFFYCFAIRKDGNAKLEYGLLEDGTAVITGYEVFSDELVIPEEVDGIPVTMVARVTIEKIDYTPLRQIKKLTLPSSLKSIRHMAFEHCGGLTEVVIPEGVESIEDGAFRGCQSLSNVELPQGLRRIGEAAFSNCSALNMPNLPSTLEEIGNQAFYGCTRFSEITLPESVRTIGNQTFSDCKTKTLTLNDGLVSIGFKAFYGNKLTDVEIPASVKQIGDGAFQPADGKYLNSATIKSIRTQYGKGVFGYDDGWHEFYLAHQDQLNIAGTLFDKDDTDNWHDYYADPAYFQQKTLNLSCYSGSTADLLYQYHVNKTTLQASADNIVTAPSDRVLQAGLYQAEDMISELIIPEGVEEIADHALEGLGTLTKVTIPSTMVRIGAYAFNKCVGLTEITLPEGLNDIGEGAFRDCWELTKVNIPDGTTEIKDSTFENCKKLSTVTMPKTGIIRIGKSAFAGCETLTVLKMEKGLEEIGESAFANCGLKEAKIPDTVTSLGKKAFARSGLVKLTLPAGLEEIPEGLCEYSTQLNTVQFPKSLKRIGKNAFQWSRIKNLTLPEGLLTIGENAFGVDPDRSLQTYRDSKGKKTTSDLKSVKFPASLTVIEKNAFAGCDSLTSISFPSKSALTEIGEDAFAMCVRLTKFTAPNSLQKIGKGAFRMCLKLSEVNLGKGITETGDEAFSGCIGMKTLTVPAGLTEIGKDMLKNYGSKLKVNCVQDSPMHEYMKKYYPAVKLALRKQ